MRAARATGNELPALVVEVAVLGFRGDAVTVMDHEPIGVPRWLLLAAPYPLVPIDESGRRGTMEGGQCRSGVDDFVEALRTAVAVVTKARRLGAILAANVPVVTHGP